MSATTGSYRLKKLEGNIFSLSYFNYSGRRHVGSIRKSALTGSWLYSLSKRSLEADDQPAESKSDARLRLIEQHQEIIEIERAEYDAYQENRKRALLNHANDAIGLFERHIESTNLPCVYGKDALDAAKKDPASLASSLFLIHETEQANTFVVTTLKSAASGIRLKHATLDFPAMIDYVRSSV